MRCVDTRGGETAICLEVAWVSEPCDLLDMVKGEYLLPLRGQLGSCRHSSGKRVVVFVLLLLLIVLRPWPAFGMPDPAHELQHQ